jgi:hypothetical protein
MTLQEDISSHNSNWRELGVETTADERAGNHTEQTLDQGRDSSVTAFGLLEALKSNFRQPIADAFCA